MNKSACLRPGTPRRGEEARRVLPVLVCVYTTYGRGDVHVGYRGAGVGMGGSKEGPGDEVEGACS